MIRMWVLFGFMILLILAVGSCTECKKVDVIEGGNASLPFATSGLTFFYEIHCEERTKTKIGQYCGPADNCSNQSTTGVSIESGHLIVHNVTYNRCYSVIPEKNTPGKETCYNITVNKIHTKVSPPNEYTNIIIICVSVAAVVVAVILCVIITVWNKCKSYIPVNAQVAPV